MKEYKVIEITKWGIPEEFPYKGKSLGEYTEMKINEFAKNGWKLITINNETDRDGGGPLGFTVFLEREI